MKTYARIEGGVVVELFQTDGDITEMFHPDIVWMDVSSGAGVAEGWRLVGDQFLPPSRPSVDALKTRQIVDINATCETAIAAIQAGYPASEVLSWPKQEAEARSYAADPGAATPILDALAEARGIDKAELARRVILKADAFAQYSGAVIGKRQGLEDALNALPADATVEQIAAIAW